MDKNVLIVTGSDYSPIVYQGFEEAKALGYKLYLLSDGSFEPRSGIFEKHFAYDLRKTKEVLEYMGTQPIKFDAVTIKTSEWLTPLTALLAKQYGCIGNDPIVAFNCRSKYHMRQKLDEGSVPIPKYKLCRNYDELFGAVNEIGIPCIAKPVGGNASYGTFMIRSEEDLKELKQNYDTSIEYLKSKALLEDVFAFTNEEMDLIGVADHVDMITDYLVEEYMFGPEISVDALVQDGNVSIMGIEDQIRMAPPYVLQTSAKLPYICDTNRQKEIEHLIRETVKAMGIKNSATHTEIIFTPTGGKIVEIGCRIGGDDLHDTIYYVTGYNLMFESIMIALGEKRSYDPMPTFLCHTAMQFIFPEKEGTIKDIIIPDYLVKDPNVTGIQLLKSIGDKVAPPPVSYDYLGYVSVKGSTPEDANKNLQEALSKINFIIS